MKRFGVAVLFGLFVLGATPARADSIMGFTGTGSGADVVVTGTALHGSTEAAFAGELDWRWLTATPTGFASNFYSYCVDLLDDAITTTPPGETVTIYDTSATQPPALDTPPTADAVGKAAWLFDTFATGIDALARTNTSLANTDAAALQIAIWESLYDNLPNLSAGAFVLSTLTNTYYGDYAPIYAQATTYLSDLFDGQTIGSAQFDDTQYQTSSATWLDSHNVTGGPGQDQITHVAEPTTLVLFGVGLAAIAMERRRRLI